MTMDYTPGRLTPSQELLRYFKYDHLPEPLQAISRECASLARYIEEGTPDGPEKTMGIRKLLEAKDCFVRANLPRPPEEPYIGTPGEAYKDAPHPDNPATPYHDARDEVGRFAEGES